jgi:hypothetical protein
MLIPPILDNKHTSERPVFAPAALLREARRQKGLDTLEVPHVCILDPDGDLVSQLRRTVAATPFAGWPCYHTELVRAVGLTAIVHRAAQRTPVGLCMANDNGAAD